MKTKSIQNNHIKVKVNILSLRGILLTFWYLYWRLCITLPSWRQSIHVFLFNEYCGTVVVGLTTADDIKQPKRFSYFQAAVMI